MHIVTSLLGAAGLCDLSTDDGDSTGSFLIVPLPAGRTSVEVRLLTRRGLVCGFGDTGLAGVLLVAGLLSLDTTAYAGLTVACGRAPGTTGVVRTPTRGGATVVLLTNILLVTKAGLLTGTGVVTGGF